MSELRTPQWVKDESDAMAARTKRVAEHIESLPDGKVRIEGACIGDSLRVRQPSFADMSSAQRSASMDATVRQVAGLTAANNELNARINSIDERLDACERYMASAMSRQPQSFMARLRWLLTGR